MDGGEAFEGVAERAEIDATLDPKPVVHFAAQSLSDVKELGEQYLQRKERRERLSITNSANVKISFFEILYKLYISTKVRPLNFKTREFKHLLIRKL